MRVSSYFAILVASVAHLMAVPLCFAEEGRELKVEQQPLSESLKSVANEFGLDIAFFPETTAGLNGVALAGNYTSEQALDALLDNTPLEYMRLDNGTIVVREKQGAGGGDKTSEGSSNQGNASTTPSPTLRAQASTANNTTTEEELSGSSEERVVLSKIVVTGTHIRGGETNPTVPLVVMDREFIDATGYSTAIQLIESLPQNFALVNQSVTGGALSGNSYSVVQGSTISLRGVGEGTTLTLINGRRVPLGYDGSAVNIAALPLSAIDRVEVVTDGASALYGSDAVGGVVNFILRKDFDGAETRLRGGAAEDVDELRLSQTIGRSWYTGDISVTGEYYQRDMLLGTDRDFGIGPNTTIGSLLPEEKNFAVTLFGRQSLTDNLEMFLDVLYTDRDSENRASHQTPTSNQTTYVDNVQLSATAGLALDFATDWRAEFSVAYGEDDADVELIDPLSPFVASAEIPVLFELQGAELKADGSLFELPGGTVRMAAGAQWREESQLSRNVFRNQAGVIITDVTFERDRQVDSLFAEASVPLVGEGNARSGLQSLDLSLAVRYDDYSDFGSSTDPRVGVAWKPAESLLVRGSWGTSFVAPRMREFDVSFNSALAVADYPGADGLHLLQVNGNAAESLGPQESENYTVGLEWTPTFMLGTHFAVNYYNIEYENRIDTIGGLSYFTINSDRAAYEGVAIFDPTEAQVLEYIAYGTAGGRPFLPLNADFTFNPNFQPGDVDLIIDARRQNIGVLKTNGFDVSASYDFDAFGGHMRLALDGSWMNEFTRQITSTSTPVEMSDTFANPLRRRLRGQISFSTGGFVSNAFVHYRNSYVDNRFPPFVDIGSYTTIDANVGYVFAESSGLLSGTTLSLNVINLLDEDPPATRIRPTTGVYDLGFDPANASPLGRLVSLELSKLW